MAGLLDFLESPAGLGLISAAAGGMAGARRGTPWNNAGRGLLAGVAGYGNALERQREQAQLDLQAQDRAQMRDFRDIQMTQARTQMEREKAQQAWREGLPEVVKQAQPQTYSLVDTLGDGSGVGLASTPGNPQAVRDYLMRAESPWADDIMRLQYFPKPLQPFTLAPGETHYSGDGKIIAVGPAKQSSDEDDAKIKQFKFAQQNGYKGTFEQFVTLGPALMAAAQAPLRAAQIDNITAENAYNLPPPLPKPSGTQAGPATVSVGGKTYAFPDQESANKFKKQAGIQ